MTTTGIDPFGRWKIKCIEEEINFQLIYGIDQHVIEHAKTFSMVIIIALNIHFAGGGNAVVVLNEFRHFANAFNGIRACIVLSSIEMITVAKMMVFHTYQFTQYLQCIMHQSAMAGIRPHI